MKNPEPLSKLTFLIAIVVFIISIENSDTGNKKNTAKLFSIINRNRSIFLLT